MKVYKAEDIAEFILKYLDLRGIKIENMKLSKILYFLQGFHYIVYGQELFENDFEAWAYGPTIDRIYRIYSLFGADVISLKSSLLNLYKIFKSESEEINKETQKFIVRYVDELVKYTAMELSDTSRKKSSPWDLVYKVGQKNIIPKNTIKKYFIEKNKEQKMKEKKECAICGRYEYLEEHHLIPGNGLRKLSDQYHLTINICRNCHNMIHHDKEFLEISKKWGQKKFEKDHTRKEFIEIFGRSYL